MISRWCFFPFRDSYIDFESSVYSVLLVENVIFPLDLLHSLSVCFRGEIVFLASRK